MAEQLTRLQALAKQRRAHLRWPVIDKISSDPHEQAALVLTDPVARQHTVVRSPQRAARSPWHDLELLHALVRAQLAETVHPLFAVAWLTNATPRERTLLNPFLLAASGWFTLALMMELVPTAQRQYNNHVVTALKKVAENAQEMSEQQLVLLGLALAAYKRYNAPQMPLADARCTLRDYTRAFLAAEPVTDVTALTALANALLAVCGQGPVVLTPTGEGFDAWQLVRDEPEDTPA